MLSREVEQRPFMVQSTITSAIQRSLPTRTKTAPLDCRDRYLIDTNLEVRWAVRFNKNGCFSFFRSSRSSFAVRRQAPTLCQQRILYPLVRLARRLSFND